MSHIVEGIKSEKYVISEKENCENSPESKVGGLDRPNLSYISILVSDNSVVL